MTTGRDLYETLGLTHSATNVEIRRAYRTLLSTAHPDKGGDPKRFTDIQLAFTILNDVEKREHYDATGEIEKTADEEFIEVFAGGKFRDCSLTRQPETNVEEQIAIRNSDDFKSHTAGFEAWIRSRGTTDVYTAETVADNFGVTKSSYSGVPIPTRVIDQVVCEGLTKDVNNLCTTSTASPVELEWGQVFVQMKYAPMNPADFYTVRTGGLYGFDNTECPLTCGHDGIGIVDKVGPGVTSLSENDWVIPFKPFFGSWSTFVVTKATEVLKVPNALSQMEYGAILTEMCLAYRLIENHGKLLPGDCVILNGANSTVGQILIQLCRLLHLKCIAVVRQRDPQKHELLKASLSRLGATHIFVDSGNLKNEVSKLKYAAKPKLALDCIGGSSTLWLTEALADDGELTIYGCMSGIAPSWSWQTWVFKNIKVSGFNLRRWMSTQSKSKLSKIMEALVKLINNRKLDVNYTEYDFPQEFDEALCHAIAAQKDTKIILKMTDRQNNIA